MIRSEDNAYNLLFLGAILVGGILALVSWFKPKGMARALYATATLHGAIALYALVTGMDARGAFFAMCFVLPYLFSAGLFSLSAKQAGAPFASPSP